MSGLSKNGLRDMRPITHSQADVRSSCHADCFYSCSFDRLALTAAAKTFGAGRTLGFLDSKPVIRAILFA